MTLELRIQGPREEGRVRPTKDIPVSATKAMELEI